MKNAPKKSITPDERARIQEELQQAFSQTQDALLFMLGRIERSTELTIRALQNESLMASPHAGSIAEGAAAVAGTVRQLRQICIEFTQSQNALIGALEAWLKVAETQG